MNDFGHWECNTSIPPNAIGFVYKITELSTNKFYIGCKLLKKKVTRKPLKGNKRKRIDYVDSDWKTYCSSSGSMKEQFTNSKENYKFQILSFHDSKTTLKIEETKLIIENIFDDNCYNQIVNIRLRVKK